MKISITVETKLIRKSLILVFWLFIWEICSLILSNSILLPSPFEVLKSLIFYMGKAYFWKCVFESVVRVIIGISVSIILGIIVGIFAGLNNSIEDFLQPVVVTV